MQSAFDVCLHWIHWRSSWRSGIRFRDQLFRLQRRRQALVHSDRFLGGKTEHNMAVMLVMTLFSIDGGQVSSVALNENAFLLDEMILLRN